MRLLFDINHPAHIHLFRNLIARVREEGDEVLAATRDKDVTVDLCKAYEIKQIVLSQAYSGQLLWGAWEILVRTLKLFKVACKFKPDALIGTSLSIGIVGKLIGRPSFVFCEDDADVVPIFAKVVYPTCSYVVTPDCLKKEDYGPKHLKYAGYHELAYLHPDHFTPDPEVLHSVGLDGDKPYFIIRSVSFKSIHDSRAGGLDWDVVRKLLHILIDYGRVIITAEGTLHDEFKKYQFPLPPDKLHDILAFASMYIGDSQTVAIEASMLGVPNLRCNTFVGRITCLEELEKNYGLTKGFLPSKTDNLYATVLEWLRNIDDVRKDMQLKRKKMLSEKINVAEWQWHMFSEKLSPK